MHKTQNLSTSILILRKHPWDICAVLSKLSAHVQWIIPKTNSERRKMSEKNYKCSKCGHNHRYTSKIGMKHLQYKTSEPKTDINTLLIKDNNHPIPEQEPKTPHKFKGTPNKTKNLIQVYRESYRIGVEKYGVWWKISQLSLWSFALIFLLTAGIILVVYLPKI